jgi:hypothetical protein
MGFPPNLRLAKLSIEPIELIDDVDGQKGLKSLINNGIA